MRIERASGWPTLPRWALFVAFAYPALVGLGVWVQGRPGIGAQDLCMFRRMTGRPCPTCGTTHMVLATTHGRFGEAFRWNPLMFGVCVGGLAMLVLRVGFRRRVVWITSAQSRRVVTMALLVAVLANWLYLLAVT